MRLPFTDTFHFRFVQTVYFILNTLFLSFHFCDNTFLNNSILVEYSDNFSAGSFLCISLTNLPAIVFIFLSAFLAIFSCFLLFLNLLGIHPLGIDNSTSLPSFYNFALTLSLLFRLFLWHSPHYVTDLLIIFL